MNSFIHEVAPEHVNIEPFLDGGTISIRDPDGGRLKIDVATWSDLIAIGAKIERLAREGAAQSAVQPDAVLGGEPKPNSEAVTPEVPQTLSL